MSLRDTHRVRARRMEPHPHTGDEYSRLVRLLVVDDARDTLEQLEKALWIWPHRFAVARDADDAERLCRHLTPTAIVVAADRAGRQDGDRIAQLRRRLPKVPIVAVVTAKQAASPAKLLERGADLLVTRDDLHRPTLYGLLMSVQRSSRKSPPPVAQRAPALAFPWRQSDLFGALICDISGVIVDANRRLVEWLGYDGDDGVTGRCVWRDLLLRRQDWDEWKPVAGDTQACLRQQCDMRTSDAQVLRMRVEVVAAPDTPVYLQAICLDQTELALLSGRCA